jgi:hypothetical protein
MVDSRGIATFWGSEIICDIGALCALQLVIGHVLAAMILTTKFRFATHNRMLKLLQDRFFVVGWDVFVSMEALGIDPFNPKLVTADGVATTNCSFAAWLQQMYTSGPSGYVEFVGDVVFE